MAVLMVAGLALGQAEDGWAQPAPAPPPATDAPPPASDAPPPATDGPPPATDAPPPATDTPPPASDAPPPATDGPPGTTAPAQQSPDSDDLSLDVLPIDHEGQDGDAVDDVDDGDDAANQPVRTGALRAGIYDDTDHTTVFRTLADLTSTWGHWFLGGTAGVDAVTSASIDVRTSPLSAVDVVTSASGRTSTSAGKMTDTRLQVTGAGGWDDGSGHKLTLNAAGAAEADYASLSAGTNGSIDLLARNLTLLGGLSLTQNWIHSVLDRSFAETMHSAAWSAGVAVVLSPSDIVRLRYDGSASIGYQGSPYRNVRFGDWTAVTGLNQHITFENTLGSADGLAEKVPDRRFSHAAEIELVHALGDGIGLHPRLRLGRDSWGVRSLTASLDLRLVNDRWRLDTGYRFYLQSAARFFRGKYTEAPSMYTDYTSDKELGREVGHIVHLDLSRVLRPPQHQGDTRLLLDGQLSIMHYSYPGFVLLDGRSGAFLELGLTWEL